MCRKCYRNKASSNTWCNFCNAKYKRERRRADPELYKREKIRARDNELQKLYGITLIQFEWMLELQDNRCKICDVEFTGNSYKRASVDHCHTTGVVRGLLCLMCNRMLGNAKDNPDLLRKAADYLELVRI